MITTFIMAIIKSHRNFNHKTGCWPIGRFALPFDICHGIGPCKPCGFGDALFSQDKKCDFRTRRFTRSVTIESGCDESGLKLSAFYLRAIVNRAVWNQIKQVTAFSKTSNSLYRAQPGTEIASKIKSTLVVDKTIRSKKVVLVYPLLLPLVLLPNSKVCEDG